MKLLIVYLSALIILQNANARPKQNDNGDDSEAVDYGDNFKIIEEEIQKILNEVQNVNARRKPNENGDGLEVVDYKEIVKNIEGILKILNEEKERYKNDETLQNRVRRNVGTNNNGNFVTNFFSNIGKRVNNFLHKEKHIITQQNYPVNTANVNHKYYSCKIKKNATNRNGDNDNSYDKIYYDFVKNTKTNTYNTFNVTVIHGYHGDIHVQSTQNNKMTNNLNNINNKPTSVNKIYATATPRGLLPPNDLQNSYRNANVPVAEEKVTKKVVNDAECILVGNGCPQGFIRDPSGRFCLPEYAQMDDELILDQDYD